MTVKTAPHGHGTITAGMPNVFYREHGTDTVTARRGPFHTHTKSVLITAIGMKRRCYKVRFGTCSGQEAKKKKQISLCHDVVICIFDLHCFVSYETKSSKAETGFHNNEMDDFQGDSVAD